jgi:hypothetical protein
MKKKALLIATLFGATTSFAQIESTNGWQVLPEAGDIAVGMDAIPVIDFALNAINIMNNTGQTGANPGYVTGYTQTLVGKYFVDAETAYRAKVRIGMGSTSNTTLVTDVTSTATPPAMVEDVEKIGSSNITLMGGIEKRRGHNRLQGFYGGEAGIMLGGGKSTYEYGNGLSTTNTAHTNTFGQGAGLLEAKNGSTFGFILRGFGGVEYFFAPKISIGAEFGWGLDFSSTGDGETQVEAWNGTGAETTTTTTAGGSNFSLDVDNASAALTINFHF